LLGAAVALSAITLTPARADWIRFGGCAGGWGSYNCVEREGPAGDPYIRLVPAPDDEVGKEQAATRDRKWMERCRPVIAQDRYGVPRYRYAAPGCEFGVVE
jgi:hypothetical protein